MKHKFDIRMFDGLRHETIGYDDCVKFPIEQAINVIGKDEAGDSDALHIPAIRSTGFSFFFSLSNLMLLFVAAVDYGQKHNKLNDFGYVSTCIIQPMSSFLDSFGRRYYGREYNAYKDLIKNLRWFCFYHYKPSFKQTIPFGPNKSVYPTIPLPKPAPFLIHQHRDIQSVFLYPITTSIINEVTDMYLDYIRQMNVEANPPLDSVLLDYSALTGWGKVYKSSPTNW